MVKNKSIEIFTPKKSEFAIETTDDFIKLPCLTVINGKRHSGKTLATVNYIREMKNRGYCDRCLVITPTYDSNKSTWDIAKIEAEDCFDPSKHVLKTIRKIIQEEKDDWDRYKHEMKLYKEYLSVIAGNSLNLKDSKLIERLLLYSDMNFLDGPPKYKYGNRPARLSLVIDDSMGTDIMLPSAGLTKFVIAHRHWSQGMGISVFMLVQSYTAGASQGLSRAIREQTTQLWLFKIAQEKQLQLIYQEADLDINYEKYIKLCNIIHEEQYNFLLLDFNAKTPDKKYRNGFKEFIPITTLD